MPVIEGIYQPTPADLIRIRPKSDMFKVSGDGVFSTLQGEGITAGEPAVFLRLHYCNLACGINGGWQCDTGYTWDKNREEYWKEPMDWGFAETAAKIESSWQEKFGVRSAKRLVVTGGEPLLQQRKIAELLARLPDWQVEIETNGTIAPIPELAGCQFNCSPKLANSGNSLAKRYKPEVLAAINKLPRSQFKFVVSDVSDLAEVERIINECALEAEKVLIMPEGVTVEAVMAHAGMIKEAVRTKGWQITLRKQLEWFGSKRRT